ncbi:NAD-dependent epimerase/dehydratase family protein [Mycolicibacillus trivialis]|uniref:Diaminohydroxyphosphoribosylaminopyrimidine deaminase n=1 Tax=Mycolicibacillus trivialis TaxID=1798 RepID=A0A1X2ENJ0_9MYCO|nr:NAD-dependent epimerase/dehydratase family protein [Mycolicibacillus trivialis]ORX07272.1 diaminohydroxyphosphoribosylaminopyrimidine deaminase [Mycolicibacillus trivialis]
MTTVDPNAPVLVTGGSGYVASWIVRYLLEDGHRVRATVRDPQKPHGLEHLHALAAQHPDRLSLHRADLLEPDSFTAAMDGCHLVIHTASPFLMGTVRDPHEQLIRPALEGTRNVLTSVNATESVKRVVLTSSVAAIYGDNADMAGKDCFTEADWNTTSTVDHQAYSYSKTVAEREAWAIQQAQQRWDLVTIHPSLVLGPALTTSSVSGSMTTMRHFVDMSMAMGAPALQLGAVDVRDVARAHIAAGFTADAHGRYVVNSEIVSMLGLSRMLRRHFGPRLAFPTRELPKFLIKLAAPVGGLTRTYVERNVGWPLCFDGSRAPAELGITLRPVEDSVVEHFQQMIDDGSARR